MSEKLVVGGKEFRGDRIDLPKCALLVIQGTKGMLGCGYVSLTAAEKFGDALATVSGVASFGDMLGAEVKGVSAAAVALGVKVGMTGREALETMERQNNH